MALRAKKPETIQKRLKLFMYGPAGVGKTTAAIQFPNSYIIDAERGTEHYDKLINASGSAVFSTTDMAEVVAEVKSLLVEKHEFRTLVIDPVTPLYNDLLEKSEKKVGSEFGRHYGEANKLMKRLANLILALDMNVIVTAHAKKEYGQNLALLGMTFDGWKSLDYWFDLVIELGRDPNFDPNAKRGKTKGRFARVVKTRLEQFPDGETFEWSYQEVSKRYGAKTIEREAAVVSLATAEQVKELNELLAVVRLPEGTTDKWLSKANVDTFEDMPADHIIKCIEYVRARLPGQTAA